MMNDQRRVEGIPFDRGDTAESYAQMRADEYGRRIHVMGSEDGISWDVMFTAFPKDERPQT